MRLDVPCSLLSAFRLVFDSVVAYPPPPIMRKRNLFRGEYIYA